MINMRKHLNIARVMRAVPLFGLLMLLLAMSRAVFAATDYEILEWTDLMPAIDLAAIQNQVIDHGQVEDSAAEPVWESEDTEVSDDGWDTLEDSFQEDAYQSALVSTRTVDTLDGKSVKLPGFIVPLEFDDEMTITQFFLVPYFGACIHLPPPPPNQMVLVNAPDGIQMDTLYTPFWISGELSIQIMENEIGASAYAMQMDSLEVYEY